MKIYIKVKQNKSNDWTIYYGCTDKRLLFI